MKTSEKLKLRFNDCGFECEGDDGTLLDEVALLEDVVEAAKDTIDFDADTPTIRLRMVNTLIDAFAKLEKQL